MLDCYNGANVILGGDFNVDFCRDTVHTQLLCDFIARRGLVPCHVLSEYDVDYSFCFNHTRYNILDHFILSPALSHAAHVAVSVIHDVDNNSDHCPILLVLPIVVSNLTTATSVPPDHKLAWYKCTETQLRSYADSLKELLGFLHVPVAAVACDNPVCTDTSHLSDINHYARDIFDCCFKAADKCIPSTKCKDGQNIIPGWKTHVQPFREKALFWHNIWNDSGRPRDGWVAQIRRATRANYHRAVRNTVRIKNDIIKERIADGLLNSKHRDYWHEVKKIRRHGRTLPLVVDNCKDPIEIANLFGDSYTKLLSSVPTPQLALESIRHDIDSQLLPQHKPYRFVISSNDVMNAVHKLKHGKRDGDLGLSSDFFIHACMELFVHLALLISAMFSHGLPIEDMCISTIIPIPKDSKNVRESSNYRGIALSSIIGKIVDLICLSRFADQLMTSELQFGFKKGHSTNACTMLLKETVAYYTHNCSNVFCVFLDASKAFDKVRYDKLFDELVKRKLPAMVLRLFLNSYCSQVSRVNWNHTRSASFEVLNGVKQGGILSPFLFCVYIDGLLQRLKESRVGCFVGSNFLGALAYADDITLLAPTAHAMRLMLKICTEYASEYAITFNASKTKCLIFAPRMRCRIQMCQPPKFYLGDDEIEVVEKWPHLGNLLHVSEESTSAIYSSRLKFIGQANDVLGFFGNLDAVVKNDLLYKYCSSFYGSVLWDLQSAEVLRICAAWRNALRRVWHLPFAAHSLIVSAVAGREPLFDELCIRTLSFVFNCRNSCNSVVRNISQHMFLSECLAISPMGRNLLFIFDRYNIKTRDFMAQSNLSSFKHKVKHHCESYAEAAISKSNLNLLLDTLMCRDKVFYLSDFDYATLQSIINYLCTN